jgi:hypothetical protein
MQGIPIFHAEKSCSRCGGTNIDRLQRHGVTDALLTILHLYPYHCRRCYGKFYLIGRKDFTRC